MAAIKLHVFGGAVPILSRRAIPDNMAELAVNTDLVSGEIRPFKAARALHSFTGGTTFTRAARIPDPAAPDTPVWIGLTSIHGRVYRSPLANDAFSRFIKLDGNAPGTATRARINSLARIKNGDPWLKLGMPAPTVAPIVSPSGGTGTTTTHSYVYTFVNMFGEESQPSPVTTVSGRVDDTWAISSLTAPPDASDYGITHFRIYRTVTGGSGTSYYRVVEQPISTTTYDDTVPDLTLTLAALTLQSQTWREPEDFEGIVPMPNGFFAAWRGRDVFFSEPYRPWAWPAEYILTVRDRIVGCGVSGTTLVVLTESAPTVIGGTRPDSMAVEQTDFIAPCLSPESVFSAPEGVYFATTRGMMLMTPSGPSNITSQLIAETEWLARYAPTYIATVVTSRQIFGIQEDGYGFVLDKLEQRSGVTFLRNLLAFSTVWMDDYTGQLFAMFDNSVYEFFGRQDVPSACGWRSKEFFFPRPMNFAALRVSINSSFDSDSVAQPEPPSAPVPGGPWTTESTVFNYTQFNACAIGTGPAPGTPPPPGTPGASPWPFWYGVVSLDSAMADLSGIELPPNWDCYARVLANRAVVWEGPVGNNITYRLPSGFKSVIWQVEIITRVPVFSVQMAETAKELADV